MRFKLIMLLILADSTDAMKGHGLTASMLSDTATESGKASQGYESGRVISIVTNAHAVSNPSENNIATDSQDLSETGTKSGHTSKDEVISGMPTEASNNNSQNGNISSYIFLLYDL